MKPDRWPDVERLYEQVIALPVDQRAAFLANAGAEDDDLRREVGNLLDLETAATDFLEKPALRAAATTLSRALPHLKLPDVPGYEIVRELGEGGMGVVYLAEQRVPLQRMVALKLIRPGMDTRQVLARFERERQALARMDHPNIAAVFDAGSTADGRPYFVMEFVDGVPLTEYCDSRHLSIRARLSLFIQVCNAVQHAHQKGVIHRDLKPSNVLVIDQDGQPVPKVIDFGTAKSTDPTGDASTLTTDGLVFGTVEYMSPEQAAFSNDIDTTTDVYSLGVLLYELLVGCTPFNRQKVDAKALDTVLKEIRDSDPPRPSSLVSRDKNFLASVSVRGTEVGVLARQLSRDLDWIVLKALEKDRHRRYQTAASLGADVQRFQDSKPIEARPPSVAYRIRKFTRRYRGAVAATMVVAATLILGLVTSTTLYWESERNRKEMEVQKGLAESRQKAADAALSELADRSYAATIAFADTEVRSGKLASLVSARDRLSAIPPAQRNWEWWYLFNQTDDTVLKVVSMTPSVPCGYPSRSTDAWPAIALDATSRKIVVHRCTEVETWATSGTKGTPFTTRYRILALNPDTRTMVGASLTSLPNSRWTIVFFKRWTNDATSMVELGKFEDAPECADIAPDGQRMAIGFRSRERVSPDQSHSHVFEVWKAGDGRVSRFSPPVAGRDEAAANRACRVRFSPDGSLVASSGTTVDVWNAESGDSILKDGGRPGRFMQPIAFSRSGDRLAVGRSNGSIDVLLIADAGATPLHLTDSHPVPHTDAILALAFSPDGLAIASAAGKAVAFWDLAQRTRGAQVGHDADVVGLAISADGRFVYSADAVGQVRGWPVQRPTAVMQPIMAARGVPSAFSENATAFGYQDVFRLPDLQRVEFRDDAATPSRFIIRAVYALSTDGMRLYIVEQDGRKARLIARSQDRTVRVDQTFPADMPKCSTLVGSTKIALSLDDRYLALGSMNCVVVMDAITLQPVASTQLGINYVTSLLFRRDGLLILATKESRSDGPSGIQAWDWRTKTTLKTVYPPLEGQSRPTWELSQSADGERIAMLSRAFPATLVIWDRELQHEVGRLQLQVESASREDFIGVALSPDGSRAVTVSRFNTNVQVWDTVRSSLLLNLPDTDGHTSVVGFNRFGQIITGRWSGGVTIWDSGYPTPPISR